jgi:hypothetical protein
VQRRAAADEGVQHDVTLPAVGPQEGLDEPRRELPPPAQRVEAPSTAHAQEHLRHGGRVERHALQQRAVTEGSWNPFEGALGVPLFDVILRTTP